MKSFRGEIQGLRLISALLIAGFHIWGSAVSGGVDVFFVISGYFLGISLLRQSASSAEFSPISHVCRFVNRTVPEAATVLLFCLAAVIFLLPPMTWDPNLKHIFFSAAYLENFWLIKKATDYLARSDNLSLVQHFWAVSIIAQVYVSWIAVVLVSRAASARTETSMSAAATVVLSVLGVASFFWGIYNTFHNPQAAYFDPAARYWQFALGALAGLSLSGKVLPRPALVILGVALIVSCGFVIGDKFAFPGFASLWPVAGALLLLIFAGAQNCQVTRFLSMPSFVWAGGLSFGVYLWHWPLYVLYVQITGDSPTLLIGILIIAISFALSAGNKWFTGWVTTQRQSLLLAALNVSTLAVVGVLAAAIVWAVPRFASDIENMIAAVRGGPVYVPGPLTVRANLPQTYADKCNTHTLVPEVTTCSYNSNAKSGIVHLVGGSHAGHWFPAVLIAAEKLDLVVRVSTKDACTFASPDDEDLFKAERLNSSCVTWNRSLLTQIIDTRPDVVIALGSRPVFVSPEARGRSAILAEEVPDGYVEYFEVLSRSGIKTLAIRDTPWMGFNVAQCAYSILQYEGKCSRSRSSVLPISDPVWSFPKNVFFADFNDLICGAETCEPTIGSLLIYRDAHHLTVDFSRTLADPITEALSSILNAE